MKILISLVRKEFYQIVRDPSSILIAFVLPLILLLIYMYGINMDTVKVSLGIKADDLTPEVETLVKSFSQSEYVNATVFEDKDKMYDEITASRLRGAVIIPNDFSTKLSRGQAAQMLVITDGSEANLANYVQSYPAQIANLWLLTSKYAQGAKKPLVTADIRYWYNQDINSHYFILPGSLAITMTLIGILLTALVVAREWERGTMEALLSTNATKLHIVLGKYIPYFVLGMLSLAFSMFLIVVIFQIPFRGNFFVLFLVSSLFLFTCLGIGLLISTKLKDQFLASQAALAIGFLPALFLSGLMFPINSMPMFFQYLTRIMPPRYFVYFIQSEFMAGTVLEITVESSIFLLIIGLFLFGAVYKNTAMRLD